MVRRGTYTKKSEKATYLPKDNKRVKTLRILKAKGKTNKNQLIHTVGLTRSHHSKYSTLLDEMVEWGWLNKDPSTEYKGGILFSLTEVGSELADFLNEMYGNSTELSKLGMFYEYEKDSES